jgi:uncharacterized membrane protein
MAKKRKRIEFSKLLAMVITLLFVGCILFSLLTWYRQGRIPSEILGYVSTPLGVIVSGYYLKSGVENYRKISQAQPVIQPVQKQENQINEEY